MAWQPAQLSVCFSPHLPNAPRFASSSSSFPNDDGDDDSEVPTGSNPAPKQFMDLPHEARTQIYQYCLVVGKIFPYNKRLRADDQDGNAGYLETRPRQSASQQARDFHAPHLALLEVCSAIHEEARPILYQKNTVVLPTAPLTAKFFTQALRTQQEKSWLKHLELKLSCRDLSFNEEAASNIIKHSPLEFHEACWRKLAYTVWPTKVEPILKHTRLDVLTVDLTDTVCSLGCCKMDLTALLAFRDGFVHGVGPLKLEIIGVSPKPQGIVGDGSAEEKRLKMGKQFRRWTAYRRGKAKSRDHGWLCEDLFEEMQQRHQRVDEDSIN